MKGFFTWFKSNTKMKRWLCLVLVGMVFVCYGIATILTKKEMEIMDIAKIVVLFVLGFTITVIGIVYAQKRTLEMLIEASDMRLEKGRRDINIKSLIFNKKVYDKGPKVVVIGGGQGINTVLKGLKNYTSNITAIVTVSDYGKDPSQARRQLNLLPIEDIRDSIVALSYNEEIMEGLMNLKLTNNQLGDLTFSELYLYAIKKLYGDFTNAVEKSSNILNMIGKVLPVTLDEFKICAELENGMVVEEKEKIAEMVYEKVTKINRIYINPSNCIPAPGVLEAIKDAEAIILGPGSLYTNVIPNLLVKNVSKTIKDSKAIKIYISNIMTEQGQTDNYSVSDHIQAIIDHAGENIIDYCIYDTGEVIPEYVRRYNKNGQDLVEQDAQKCRDKGIKLLKENLSIITQESIRHNPKAVAEAITQIICDDLKFKDKQNDPQYIMLKTRLKEEKMKKKNLQPIFKVKQNSKHDKEEKKESKFNLKYKDRIESIQTSEERRIENRSKMEWNNKD
ncbi:MAG: YvcK family protein [Clostridia bacterium]|jgi:uncharacterized cofD-like protein|nr:YvcK family protein [Clostridia bacterium]